MDSNESEYGDSASATFVDSVSKKNSGCYTIEDP